MGRNKAVIFAGGVGSRMKLNRPKQFVELMNQPIIVKTISHFQYNELVDDIFVVIKEGYVDYIYDLASKFHLNKIRAVITGGATAMDSIYLGLLEASKNMNDEDIVLLHDGVRPLIDGELIDNNIKICREKGNCITSAKMTETPVLLKNDKIDSVLNRDDLIIAKAPQTFYLREILDVHNKLRKDSETYYNFVDCCSMFNYLKKDLNYIISGNENIKLTTEADLYKFIGLENAKSYKKILELL